MQPPKNAKVPPARPTAGATAWTTQSLWQLSVRVGVVGNISACHADARGSIPRHGETVSVFFIVRASCAALVHAKVFAHTATEPSAYPGRVFSP